MMEAIAASVQEAGFQPILNLGNTVGISRPHSRDIPENALGLAPLMGSPMTRTTSFSIFHPSSARQLGSKGAVSRTPCRSRAPTARR
jgi:hypothetical protein